MPGEKYDAGGIRFRIPHCHTVRRTKFDVFYKNIFKSLTHFAFFKAVRRDITFNKQIAIQNIRAVIRIIEYLWSIRASQIEGQKFG